MIPSMDTLSAPLAPGTMYPSLWPAFFFVEERCPNQTPLSVWSRHFKKTASILVAKATDLD